jgi:hypothetical protein
MKTRVFGVFGGRTAFEELTTPSGYDRVLEGEVTTVGVSDDALGLPGRTRIHDADDGFCVLWGEAFFEGSGRQSSAAALYDAYAEQGADALDAVNGSYLAIVERDGVARAYTDQLRSWELYYTDAPGVRAFGSDAAQVARTVEDATPDWDAVRQFTHFGNVFDEATAIRELHRVPFDGYLGPDATGDLRRFVYEPREFDYASELADRLERALERRRGLPGRTGLLLSAGYDSRIILSGTDVDQCYTVGTPDADEVQVAGELARQYDADHDVLEVDGSYLRTLYDVIQYTQGLRESLHIHHRGNDRDIDVDSIHHGLFFDTLFRGFFLPQDTLDVLGHPLPRNRLEPDPDPASHYGGLLGCFPDEALSIGECALYDESTRESFTRETIEPAIEAGFDRADSLHNAIDLLGVKLKPTLPFRAHLADNYVESFVAADRELVEWHLATPPEYRTDEVFLEALEQVDDDVLRHRPPNRPHDSYRRNQIEKFLRRKLPVVSAFETPWPDRDSIYVDNDMDQRLFPDSEVVHDLAPRTKLRINDAVSWLDATVDEPVRPRDVICSQ